METFSVESSSDFCSAALSLAKSFVLVISTLRDFLSLSSSDFSLEISSGLLTLTSIGPGLPETGTSFSVSIELPIGVAIVTAGFLINLPFASLG